MIKFEHTEVTGWEHAIRGMRNPMLSYDRSDSLFGESDVESCSLCPYDGGACINDNIVSNCINIGPNDLELMKCLRNAGTDHRKFMRMITVYVDITAPLYWWKEFDTYKVGTVANSCSTMHKIQSKKFELNDFSCEHMDEVTLDTLNYVITQLEYDRLRYLKTKDKDIWWQMIQLLPSSYNQKRTVMLNYEVLANIYKSRKNHKLDEWAEHNLEPRDWPKTEKEFKDRMREPLCTPSLERKYFGFCDWIKTLPYSELITGPSLSDIPITNEIMEEAKRRVKEGLHE